MKSKTITLKSRNSILGTTLASAIVVCLSGFASASDWNGSVDSDWNNNANWNGGGGTGASNAIINVVGTDVAAPYTATISSNIVATPVDIMVGIWGGTGKLNHTAGTSTTGGGNWAFVGREGGTGVYNLANTAVPGSGISGFSQGSGSVNFMGRLYIGGWGNNLSNGTFNINTTGTVAISYQFQIGNNEGTGVVNLESGTVTTATEWFEIGNGVGSHGTLNMSGGSITKSGNDHFIVGANGGTGAANITGGSLSVNNELWVANNGGSNGTLTISAGTVTNNSWAAIGRAGAALGTVNLSGGTWNKTGGGNFIVGDNSPGVLNLSGGALSANGEFWVGQGGSGNGTMNISGGTLATNGWMCVGRAGGTGAITMTGGTWTHTGATQFIVGSTGPGALTMSNGLVDVRDGYTFVGERVEATVASLTISGGAEFRSSFISVGPQSPNATLNLDGGAVRTRKFTGSRNENDGEDTGIGTINFNGTQITATADNVAFIAATIDNAVIGTGGLLVNSNGFALSVPKALSGTGGVVKSGTGKLSLLGLNTYSGNSTVSAGELVLRAGSSGTGNLSVADGTKLGIAAATVNDMVTSANATFGTTAAGTTLNLDMGNVNATNFTNSILNVTGNLILTGDVTVNVAGSKFAAANMQLVSYVPGNKSGAGSFVLGSVPNGVVATLVDDTVNGLVYLNITSVALPEWDGTNVAKYAKTGALTTGLFDVVVTDATNIAIGQKAFGAGIPAGATVTGISGLTISLDQTATVDSLATPVIFTIGTGTNDGVWDVTTTQNWVDQITLNLSSYKDPNPVLFSDLATGPTAVILDSTVKPSEVDFNNSTLPYSLSGTGKISDLTGGATALTKSGTQSLTLSTANDYTGVTTLAGGITTVGTLTNGLVASPLGAASSAASNLVLSGGTLNYTGATVTIDRGFTTGGQDGAISVPGGTDLTLSGPVTGGVVSSFNKQGDGSLILTNSAVTLGAIGQANEVLAGTLKFTGPAQTVSIPGELWVGSVPAAAGHLILDTTALTVGGWFTLGRGNGNAGLLSTINATNSTVVCGGFSTGYDNGLPNDSDQTVTATNTTWTTNGQTLLGESANATSILNINATSVYNANGRFLTALGNGSVVNITVLGTLNHTAEWMSVGNGSTGVCTMTVKDTGIVNSSGDFNVGDVDTANGTLNLQNSGSVTSTGNVFIGKNGTTGAVNMSGASTMTTPETNVAGNSGSKGNLNIAGTSVYTSNGRLQVGPGGGSTGNLIIEGSGRLVVNSFVSVGMDGGGSMTVKDSGSFSNNDDFSVNENGDVPAFVTLQDSGTISVGGTTFVGRNAGKVGTLTLTGGTYTGTGGEFQIGRSGTGSWLQSGGVTNAGGWVSIGRIGGSTGLLTVSGTGIFNQTGAGNALIVGEEGTGTLTIQGTATVSSVGANGLIVSNNATAIGAVNLDAGTLVAVKVSDGGGLSTFNFNGGVLKAGPGANLAFMSGLDQVNVNLGGAFIDSNGQTIAIAQSLSDGNGNLTKQGEGTLQLNGASSYLGTTTVAAGTLGGTGSVGGELVVPSVSSVAPGAAGVGTFSADDILGIGSTIGGTYVCELSGASADKLALGGDLTISPGAVLNFSLLAPPTVLSYVIASYGSHSGAFTEQNVPSGFHVVYNATTITLEYIATPYSNWAVSHGLNPLTNGVPAADPDGDGQINSIEFALGGSPSSASDNAKVFSLAADSSADDDATSELLLTIAVRSGTPVFTGSPSPTATQEGFSYTIEGSATLNSFTTAATPVTTVAPPAPNATPPVGYEYRTFSLSGSNGLPNVGFLRVKVSN